MDEERLDLLTLTSQVWQPRAGRPLSREDAREIVQNTVAFFDVLIAWSTRRADNRVQTDAPPDDRARVPVRQRPVEGADPHA